MATKVIDNFQGRLTRYHDGDMNSGYAKYATSFGHDPFTSPSNLTWFEEPTQIDPSGLVITDLIVAARPRLEMGITYVYAVGHTGRVYKIQVNSPTTYSPNFDSPALLATLTTNTPTFKYGASIQFFGATEKLYIGCDQGVTSLTYDGNTEAFIGTLGSYTQNVPRPSANFGGKLYFGNGTNLLEIDSTATVTSYAKLSPAFPVGTVVRDIDVSPDGTYLQTVVTRVTPPDQTVATQDTSSLSSGDSYLIYWNGTDAGYTAYNPFNAYSITTNISFGPYSYTMGYDLGGAAIYTGGNKIISLPDSISPSFGAMFSTGNLVGFASPESNTEFLQGAIMTYGAYDREIPEGIYRFLRLTAGTPQTDVIQMPVCAIVSNLFYGSSSAGYTGDQVGSAKLYFSTLETSGAPTTAYKLYKFTTVPTGVGNAIAGVYETQNQLFSKKVKLGEVRLYTEPLAEGVSFKIDLIGSSGEPITGATKTITVGSEAGVDNASPGQDYVWYTPVCEPTYAIGLRITNIGDVNWVLNKAEIDYYEGGK